MNRDAFKEVWDARVKTVATELQAASGAGAVMVALFDGPWMQGAEPALIGLAGTAEVDVFRVARDLRDAASMLEQQAGKIAARVPFVEEHEREKPVRQ